MDNKNIEIKSNNYTVDMNNNKYELYLNYKDTHTLLLNKQGPQGPQGEAGISNIPIGTIIPVNATSNYVPDGCLPCDGTEYSKSQFNDLWNNYLSTSLLNTCTYTKYQQDLSTYG